MYVRLPIKKQPCQGRCEGKTHWGPDLVLQATPFAVVCETSSLATWV